MIVKKSYLTGGLTEKEKKDNFYLELAEIKELLELLKKGKYNPRKEYFDREMLRSHIVSACRYFNKYGWLVDRERREMNRKILSELDGCHE